MRTERMLPRARRAPRELAVPPRPAVQAAWAPPAGARETARRQFVRVVLAIYLLAIVEGALRKYVAPQYGQYLFFVRDPFLLYAYWLVLRSGLWPAHGTMARLSAWMCVAGLLLLVLQFATGSHSEPRLVLGIHGWRSYFLYMPLAFLVGALFTRDDLLRLARLTLVLAVPVAALVVLQFFSPAGSAINVGIAEEKELQFKGMGLDAHRIRTTGPFTSTAGLQQFVVTACGFVLALLLVPAAQRRVSLPLLAVAAAGVLTCVGLSGSRGTLLQCVMTGLFAVSVGVVGRGGALRARAVVLPVGLALVAVVLYPIVFPTGFEAFMNRWNDAAVNEKHIEGGIFGRALYGLVDFVRLLGDTPLLGYGLGYGSNASILMKAEVDGVRPGDFVETDFARHMVDLGPVLGLAYIGLRVVLLAWLGGLVLQATRRASDPLPMLLFSYAGYCLLAGQITGNGSINVYGWLFVGLCIAACRGARHAGALRRPAARTALGLAAGRPPARRLAMGLR